MTLHYVVTASNSESAQSSSQEATSCVPVTRRLVTYLFVVFMFLVCNARPLSALRLKDKYLEHDCFPGEGGGGGGGGGGNAGSNSLYGRKSNLTLPWKLHNQKPSSQCLFLNNNSIKKICAMPVDQFRKRFSEVKKYRLRFCGDYPLAYVISRHDIEMKVEKMECRNFLSDLKSQDDFIQEQYSHFLDLINKFDCKAYSVKWKCLDCKDAYRKWLCSEFISLYHDDFHNGDQRVPPCTQYCSQVEQKCPFLRPEPFEAQAGEPSFICKDRDISNEELSTNCYEYCHLREEDQCDFEFTYQSKPLTSRVPMLMTTETSSGESVNSTEVTSSGQGLNSKRSHFYLLKYLLYFWMLRTLLPNLCIGMT